MGIFKSKFFWLATGIWIIFCLIMWRGREDLLKNFSTQEKTTVSFNGVTGNQINLVRTHDGGLGVSLPRFLNSSGKDEFDILRREVEFLTSQKKPFLLNGSDFTISYQGGYPVWEPVISVTNTTLVFAKGSVLVGQKHIIIHGETKKSRVYLYSAEAGYPNTRY